MGTRKATRAVLGHASGPRLACTDLRTHTKQDIMEEGDAGDGATRELSIWLHYHEEEIL